MKCEKSLVFLFLFVLLGSTTFAQTAVKDSGNSFVSVEESEVTNDNWSFQSMDEQSVYFIDFESININLSDIAIKDANGEIVFKEDVSDLPVDAIYELDLGQYGKGNYTIEVRSYTKILRKKVQI